MNCWDDILPSFKILYIFSVSHFYFLLSLSAMLILHSLFLYCLLPFLRTSLSFSEQYVSSQVPISFPFLHFFHTLSVLLSYSTFASVTSQSLSFVMHSSILPLLKFSCLPLLDQLLLNTFSLFLNFINLPIPISPLYYVSLPFPFFIPNLFHLFPPFPFLIQLLFLPTAQFPFLISHPR